MGMSKDKKVEYFRRVEELINKYSKVFVVSVSSSPLPEVRSSV
jgi:ribosomal protein L10